MQGLGERIGKDMLLICLERGVFGKLGGCMSDADVLRVWESFWAFESFFFSGAARFDGFSWVFAIAVQSPSFP